MKNFWVVIAICAVCLVIPVSGAAKTMYVTDQLHVAVRSGMGLEYKILDYVKSNERLEVLDTEGEYARVRMKNGTEGWMILRYLSDGTPKPVIIENLKADIEKLQSRNERAAGQIAALKEKNSRLLQASTGQLEKIETLAAEYEELKTSCSDFLQLEKKHTALQRELSDIRQRNTSLVEDNRQLRKNTYFKWFVAGCSFALFWFAVGMVLQALRVRKKKKLRF